MRTQSLMRAVCLCLLTSLSVTACSASDDDTQAEFDDVVEELTEDEVEQTASSDGDGDVEDGTEDNIAVASGNTAIENSEEDSIKDDELAQSSPPIPSQPRYRTPLVRKRHYTLREINSVSLLTMKAQYLLYNRRIKEATQLINRLLIRYDSFAAAYILKGNLLALQKRPRRARLYYEKALLLTPKDVELLSLIERLRGRARM